MAQGSFWTTHRAGNWSRPITFHDSPWWASDEEDGDLVGFYPANGDTVIVRHNLTVDADIIIGCSLQAAIWEPLAISTTAGSTVTALPTGSYTLGASVSSANGETHLANTVSAPFTITQGVSKPRVTFVTNPPAGCSYRLYLHGVASGDAMTLYCQDIGGTTVDLVSGFWGNNWVAGVATGGAVTNQNSTSPLLPGEANAVASGKRLLLRGDFVVESPTGSTKPFVQIGSGGTFRTDKSAATDPTRADYLMWFQGGGDIRFLG
jgi:hypothetical protein